MKYGKGMLCTLRGAVFMTVCMVMMTACAGEGTAAYEIIPENVVTEHIVIEGLQEEYQVLFLTDTHIVTGSSVDTEQMKENAEARAALFRDEQGVSSGEQFPAWMVYAGEQQADAVLFGGDVIDFPSAGTLEHLQKNLDSLTMPYLYTLGNHDWTFPWEYMTEIGKQEYLPLLEPVMEGNTAVHSLDMGEFLVVAVDNSTGQVNPDAMEEYERLLAQGKPVILVVHVPFMTQSALTKARENWDSPVVLGGGNFGGIYPNETSEEFLNMTTASDSPVELVLAGHVHFSDKDYIEGEKNVLQLIGDAGYQGKGMMLHISGEK